MHVCITVTAGTVGWLGLVSVATVLAGCDGWNHEIEYIRSITQGYHGLRMEGGLSQADINWYDVYRLVADATFVCLCVCASVYVCIV
jgi:hypothetical protein